MLTGNEVDSGNESFKIAFTIQGEYKITDESVTLKELEAGRDDFAQHLYISSRDFLSYLATQMGFNSGPLPYSLGIARGDETPKKRKKSPKPTK